LGPTAVAPPAESSRILAADGSLLTTLHGEQDRETVPLRRVPRVLVDAVVAVEDERFWQHRGVDLKSVARAVYANASEGRVVEGGSTITQQYVKNELVGPDRSVRRKLREATLAYQLERRYTKAHILELYLNAIYFGNGAYGVEAAARRYFGVGVEQLTLGQAALLAGCIQAPSRTDPYQRPEAAVARRRVVLAKMTRLGLVRPEEAVAAGDEPLALQATPVDEQSPAPYFVERVKRLVLDDERFGATPEARLDLLLRGGLRISTTLDRARQAQAEGAVAKVLSRPDRDPTAALVSIEPRTGFVRALVGGRDYYGGGPQAKFDLATQGRRPAGSSFKPFVLAAALERRIPLSRTYDAPPRLRLPLTGRTWEVDNYEGTGGAPMDLVEATVASVNTVYAQLILDVGPAQAVATAARMGVTSPLAAYPSAVLGTNDVTPLEMAAAYATLANRGVAVPPTFVTKVVAGDGRVLYDHHHVEHQALRRETADAEVGVLEQVVQRGPGVGARIGRPVAGKTGTGQQWRDAWFVGFTPELATSVWVGFPDAQRSMVPPATRVRVTGGGWPAQIWQLYTTAALADVPATPFPRPPAVARSGGSVRTVVPPVVGMPVDQAEEALDRTGLRAVRRPVPNGDYPPGYVVDQDPGGSTEEAGGSTVTLGVSRSQPAEDPPPERTGPGATG
jgi:penicillin-binding protein 1A